MVIQVRGTTAPLRSFRICRGLGAPWLPPLPQGQPIQSSPLATRRRHACRCRSLPLPGDSRRHSQRPVLRVDYGHLHPDLVAHLEALADLPLAVRPRDVRGQCALAVPTRFEAQADVLRVASVEVVGRRALHVRSEDSRVCHEAPYQTMSGRSRRVGVGEASSSSPHAGVAGSGSRPRRRAAQPIAASRGTSARRARASTTCRVGPRTRRRVSTPRRGSGGSAARLRRRPRAGGGRSGKVTCPRSAVALLSPALRPAGLAIGRRRRARPAPRRSRARTSVPRM